MLRSFALGACFLCAACTQHRHTMTSPLFTLPVETNPNQTVTYEECIGFYRKMAAAYPQIFHLEAVGSTDSGEPLHVAVLSKDGEFDAAKIRASGRRILLINNGIHPGEPEGIDATLLLLRDYLSKPELHALLEHLVVVIIPIYNIDGALNRNSYTRANQDGPEAYGFRGNARNLDLNRDFIKCDSRNARTFNHIFRHWNPDIFVDNHTSNGADYQYTMTLIATQHNKLEEPLGNFLQETMLPALYGEMKKRNWEMIPYVDGPGETPDSGIAGFVDHGRFSTGYAAMWNTIGFMPETHMLKPFADRMWSNLAFMDVVIRFIHEHHAEIGRARAAAFERTRSKPEFVIEWAMDVAKRDTLLFKGYAAKYKPSEVSGLPRLWYDRSEPYEKPIPYYNYFKPALSIAKPYAYILPQAWEPVIQRLEINGVHMQRLTEDTEIEVESYLITDFIDRKTYEGHYLHSGVELEKKTLKRGFRRGDYVILTNQDANRYLLETLEPQAPDSWFAWNFFDGAIMQKEYFSSYVFEDLAAEFLRAHPDVRAALDAKRSADSVFAGSAAAQLDWVYRQSPWYEPMHRVYPVGRLLAIRDLPLK